MKNLLTKSKWSNLANLQIKPSCFKSVQMKCNKGEMEDAEIKNKLESWKYRRKQKNHDPLNK